MTPTVREVLQGIAVVCATPISPDVGPEFAASRRGMAGMLATLAAGEAERAAAATLAENADIRSLFAAASAYDASEQLAAAAREVDEDRTTPALDAANARLRRLLVALHEQVEEAGDAQTDRAIKALYVRMAAGRRLAMGG
jgi:hypothetical protein